MSNSIMITLIICITIVIIGIIQIISTYIETRNTYNRGLFDVDIRSIKYRLDRLEDKYNGNKR